MRGREMAVFVLDEMQMLDQEIAAAGPVGQQALNFFERVVSSWRPFGVCRARRPRPPEPSKA